MRDLISSIQQQSQSNLLLIDGDSIAYIIGWNHREHQEEELVRQAVDSFVKDLLTLTDAGHYLGVISPVVDKNFRRQVYKYKPYKGTRGEDSDWIAFWKPLINSYLVDRWGFTRAPEHLETDDVVSATAVVLYGHLNFLICSPDKDLKQIPGVHYDYKKAAENPAEKQETVSKKQARYNWHMQLLTGDGVDNVAGIPKIGQKKAEKLLSDAGELMWGTTVKLAYQTAFGPYYGPIIYEQTEAVITMMTPEHPLWDVHKFPVEDYLKSVRIVDDYVRPFHSEVEREASVHMVHTALD